QGCVMGTSRRYALVVTALLAAALTPPALAQTAPSSPLPRPSEVAPVLPDPKACAPGERLQHSDGQPTAPGTSGQNLGEKLARTDGVLCPPPTGDPGMTLPPPAGGGAARPPPGGRARAGDPAARQSRRRSIGAAEVAFRPSTRAFHAGIALLDPPCRALHILRL